MEYTRTTSVTRQESLNHYGLTKEVMSVAPFCEIPEHFFDMMLEKLSCLNGPSNNRHPGSNETTIIEVTRYNLPSC